MKIDPIELIQLAILAGIGYIVYEFTSDQGWGSVTQNGHPFSLFAHIFAGQSGDGTGQIYDTTGGLGSTVSTASENLAYGTGFTPTTQASIAAGVPTNVNGTESQEALDAYGTPDDGTGTVTGQ